MTNSESPVADVVVEKLSAIAASGEDPAVAQQRADATYGFYTGTGTEA